MCVYMLLTPPIIEKKSLKKIGPYGILKQKEGTCCKQMPSMEPHSKGGASQAGLTSYSEAAHSGATEWAFLFSLVSLFEIGKQRDNPTSKRNQQSQYPKENHDGFICCHITSPPVYVH